MKARFFLVLKRRLNTCILHKAVIPADTPKGTGAGIQGLPGCRIKSGMTNYLIAGVIITVILFGMYGLSIGGVSKPMDRPVLVAVQPTATVEIFVTSWCPYCKQAIKFLKDNRIPYVVYDIEKDSAAAKRRDRLSPRQGVPFAVINGTKIYGFSAEVYSEALGLK